MAGLIILGAPAAFADTIDLYTSPPAGAGFYRTATDGTMWQIINKATQGTGLFDPFVRIRNNGTDIGMNTDAASGAYNDLNGHY